jgi:hypothetical protein
MDDREMWRPVPVSDLAKLYEVSSHGRIRRIQDGKLLTRLVAKKQGRYICSFLRNGRKTTLSVAQLVAEAFLGRRKALVFFKDKNPLNCRVENLYFGSMGSRSGRKRIDSGPGVPDVSSPDPVWRMILSAPTLTGCRTITRTEKERLLQEIRREYWHVTSKAKTSDAGNP